jgi:hypothetical protein
MTRRAAGTRAYAAILFVALFASYAYFYEAGGWNQNSRFALVRAITGRGTFRIDSFENCTGDRALYDGHFYSDKAPGVALAAVPFVAAGRLVCRAVRVDPESYAGIAALSYVATVATCGLPIALAGLCLFFVARRFGASPGAAALVVVAFGLGTPMWAYATIFYGHALSAAGLIVAYTAALALGDSDSGRRDMLLGAAVGGAAGWATVTEFPAAVPAVILTVFALARAWPHGWRRVARTAVAVGLAATACAVVLGAYHWACFGSPFHVAYTSEEGFAAMKEGFFGLSMPKVIRLRHILTGDYRGLLPLTPVLALTPIGLALLISKRVSRGAAIVAVLIAAFYILLNSSYYYWEGGWSYGPRHMSPAIGFLCLGLARLWNHGRVAGRLALGCLALYGVGLSLIAVSTMPQPPGDMYQPVSQLLWPAFQAGKLSLNPQGFTENGASVDDIVENRNPAGWNIGQRWLGLKGHASLVPLFAVWALALGTWAAVGRSVRDGRRSRNAGET